MAKTSRFSISGKISMVDRVTGTMKHINNKTRGFSAKMRRQFQKVSFSAKKLQRNLKQIGGRIMQVGLAGLAIGAAIVTRQFIKFDDAIFGATARFKDATGSTEKQTEVMERLRKAARKVGAETQFTAEQAAQGLNKFALAGFTSEEAIKSLRSQIDLATVTGEDFMQVADQSSDLLGAFGGNALKSADKVEKLKDMNALLAVATLSANVTMDDLFEGLKKSAPIATLAGIAMKDIIATTSVLGSAGLKGSLAGTAMLNMFTRLAAVTPKAARAFESLGLKQKDFINDSGGLKDVAGIFKALEEKTRGLSKVKTIAAFDAIFGKRALVGAAILKGNIGQVREQLIRMSKDPRAEMAKTAEFIRQSLGNRLRILGSTATELGFKFLQAFSVDGKNGIDSLTEAIRAFDPVPLINGLRAVGTVLSWIGKLFDILLWPARTVGRILGGIMSFYSNPAIEKAIIRNPEMLDRQSGVTGPLQTTSPASFTSPMSSTISRETTNTSKSKLDVNFNNAPKDTEFKESGGFSPMITLNTGPE